MDADFVDQAYEGRAGGAKLRRFNLCRPPVGPCGTSACQSDSVKTVLISPCERTLCMSKCYVPQSMAMISSAARIRASANIAGMAFPR